MSTTANVHLNASPVVIVGGGPVGMTLAALLAHYGIRTVVIEADAGYCDGSRAICVSRRSQEILSWVGADRALVDTGLPWTGGRSYFRDTEVLRFAMPSAPTQRYAPMVNIQQYYIEEYAHRSAEECAGMVDVRWSTRAVAVRQGATGVEIDIEGVGGERSTLRADWLAACDGGRSTVREQLGLRFDGMQYEGRYVIVDIEQETRREVERLAWFDPPSNPGSTILMHRQPGNVWRIDYQIGDDEDPAEAVKPEQVLPRVRSHLEMIGETAPWKPLWISIYNAKCLTLDDYRHGRVLFAGDAAHLVPIFGVRGLNSGLDDAGNLAWKLALVLQGKSHHRLLDSYLIERVHATRQNIAFGAKSTEFMAPPHFGFKLMREAALRLATENERVRSLINPRQSTPISYPGSPLNATARGQGTELSPDAGDPAPEALLSNGHLTCEFGHDFVALYFSDHGALPSALTEIEGPPDAGLARLRVQRISRDPVTVDSMTLIDASGEAWQRYHATEGALFVIRPDGYILGRWPRADASALHAMRAALEPFRRNMTEVDATNLETTSP